MEAIEYSKCKDFTDLTTWHEQETLNLTKQESDVDKPLIFSCDKDINNKIRLWNGQINRLCVQSLVVSINSLMEHNNSIDSRRLMELGGRNYQEQFISKVIGCKTGEVRLVECYGLPSSYIMHTVAPRYNPKFESAAINALYNCYRNSLMVALEKGMESVLFSQLHISKYPFPLEPAIHLQARTFRRFLEKFHSKVECIAIQVPPDLQVLFARIFPIYFPRNTDEEEYSKLNTPDDIGNENGQPTQPERNIRISAFPYGPTRKSISDDEEEEDSQEEDDVISSNSGEFVTLDNPNTVTPPLSAITSSGKHSLSKPKMAPALIRQSLVATTRASHASIATAAGHESSKIDRTLRHYESSLTSERRFDRLLRHSRQMNWTQFHGSRAFYQCGRHSNGDPIFIIVERNIPNNLNSISQDALGYIIGLLERDAKSRSFSLIYATDLSNSRPPRRFLSLASEVLTSRYLKQMHSLLILHASFYTRAVIWLMFTITMPHIKDKLSYVLNLRQLYRLLNPATLDLPDFIYDIDKQIGGSNSLAVTNVAAPSDLSNHRTAPSDESSDAGVGQGKPHFVTGNTNQSSNYYAL